MPDRSDRRPAQSGAAAPSEPSQATEPAATPVQTPRPGYVDAVQDITTGAAEAASALAGNAG